MKKKFFILFALMGLCSVCFAQSAKYLYAFITERSVIIADLIPKEIHRLGLWCGGALHMDSN